MQKSLTKNSLYYLIYNVLNTVFPFLTGIYVTHVLLPNDIGTVAAAQNLAQYFVILAFLGIPTYGLREISRTRYDRAECNRVFSELYLINLISTITFLLIYVVLVLSVQVYREYIHLYLITGLTIALNAFNIGWLYEGLEEFRFISIRNLIFKSVSFLFLVLFVRTANDIMPYALVNVVGSAGNSILNMVHSRRHVTLCFKQLNLRRHMKSIMYLVAVNLSIELYSLVDITMMNLLCESDHIAFYKYGRSIEVVLLQAVNTFTMVIVPRISLYYKEKQYDEFNKLITKGLNMIVLCALPMILGIYFTGGFLLTKIYGEAYIVSADVLKILSLLVLISPIGYLLGSRVLLVSGHENQMIYAVGVGAVTNIIGNAFLIPRYAELGAATASVISELFVAIIYILMGAKYFKLHKSWNNILKIIVANLIMTAYLWITAKILPVNWLTIGMQILGAVAIYIVSLLLGKEIVVSEYMHLFRGKLRRQV